MSNRIGKRLYTSLVILLLFSSTTAFIGPVFANQTRVYVDPPSIVNPGLLPPATFSISVKVANVTGLFGYEFKLYYNTNILDGLSIQLPPGHFLTPAIDPGNLFIVKQEILDNFNATHGRVWVSMTLLAPEAPKSGSGTLAIINFKVTGVGSSAFDLNPTKLSDVSALPIAHTTEDGYFNNVSSAARLYVNPTSIFNLDLVVCHNFTINVDVLNVINLYSWEFKLYYKNDILNATSAVEGPFLNSSGPTNFQIKALNQHFNSTHGLVWLACSLLSPPPVTGNGTLATITFHVEGLGDSILDLTNTSLKDQFGVSIPHTVLDGYFNNVLKAHLFVDPPSIIDPTMQPPAYFNISIRIANVTNLYAFEFKLGYKTSMLNCLGAIVIPFDNETNFTLKLGVDDPAGFVYVNVTYYPPAIPLSTTDPVTLAMLFFQVTGMGESVLDLYDTKLTDPWGGNIPHDVSDGFISILRHDVAVINVVPSKNETYAGRIVHINVTVENQGDAIETFNVSAYYDSNLIGTTLVVGLNPNETRTHTFNWDTTGVAPCHNYTMKGEASVVPYETDTADNIFIDGTVHIKMLGDVNGDGRVDLFDLVIVAAAFGTRTGDIGWDERADLAEDGVIDVFDIVIIGYYFGETC